MVAEHKALDTMLRLSCITIELQFRMIVLRYFQVVMASPVLGLVDFACLAESDQAAQARQEWFLYNYKEGKDFVLPRKPPLRRRGVMIH